MADVLKYLLLVMGILVVFVSYWLAAEALFPGAVDCARRQYDSHIIKITLLGLVVMGPLLVVGFLLLSKASNPLGKLAGAALIGMPVLPGLLGSAGLSQRIGRGLPSATDERQPWRRVLRGGMILALMFLLPLVGWLIVMPWTVISGLGAALLAFSRKGRESEPAAGVAVDVNKTTV